MLLNKPQLSTACTAGKKNDEKRLLSFFFTLQRLQYRQQKAWIFKTFKPETLFYLLIIRVALFVYENSWGSEM